MIEEKQGLCKKMILVPEKDCWELEDGSFSVNIFWMQGCPDVVLEKIFEKKIGFVPRGGDIESLRYPKQYELIITSRDEK